MRTREGSSRVWSCGVVDWTDRPLNEQSVAWFDSLSQYARDFACAWSISCPPRVLAHWPGCSLQRLLPCQLLSLRRWIFASICPHSRVEFPAFSSRGCYSRRIVVIFCRCGDLLPFSLVFCSPRRAGVPSVSLWIRFCYPLRFLRLTAAAAVA